MHERQILVQLCSLATLASIRKEQGRNGRWRVHDVYHQWSSLESSLSRPVLPLLGCRPPMLVRVAPEGGAYAGNFCAKDRCLCSATRWRHWLPYEGSRDGNGRWRVHDVYSRMTESGELAFPARPSASWLQAPNTSARCTRRGAYAVGFSYSLYLSPNPIAGGRGQGAVR